MYNGIGLQTARGSGTNGYVQTNKFFIRPKSNKSSDASEPFDTDQGTAGVRKANTDILEHDRKRQIELKLVVLEDKLADQGYTDGEIAERIAEARSVLEMAANAAFVESGGAASALAITDSNEPDEHHGEWDHATSPPTTFSLSNVRCCTEEGYADIPNEGSSSQSWEARLFEQNQAHHEAHLGSLTSMMGSITNLTDNFNSFRMDVYQRFDTYDNQFAQWDDRYNQHFQYHQGNDDDNNDGDMG